MTPLLSVGLGEPVCVFLRMPSMKIRRAPALSLVTAT
jgi:hypothetical protein